MKKLFLILVVSLLFSDAKVSRADLRNERIQREEYYRQDIICRDRVRNEASTSELSGFFGYKSYTFIRVAGSDVYMVDTTATSGCNLKWEKTDTIGVQNSDGVNTWVYYIENNGKEICKYGRGVNEGPNDVRKECMDIKHQ